MKDIRAMVAEDRNDEVLLHSTEMFRLLPVEELEYLRLRNAVMDIKHDENINSSSS